MTHVLIVEDHEGNRALLRILLEANGYQVTSAGNGLEALAAARQERPDVIVSDVLMPKMDGFALCRTWMQDAALRVIPFIFYSGTYIRPDDQEFAMALGAVRYLIKPVEAEVFLRELRAVLQEWAGREAPVPVSPLDDATSLARHEDALARKVEDKMLQLEEANRRLRESEAKYRRIYDNLQDVYVETSLDGTILEMSPQVATLSKGQYKREDLIGTSVNALYADSCYRDAILQAIKQRGRAIDVESTFRNKDGSLIPCSVSATIVRGADGEMRTAATLRDITERKGSERDQVEVESQFRSLVEQWFAGIFVIQEQTLVYCNPRFAEILGYASESELKGRDLLMIPAVTAIMAHVELAAAPAEYASADTQAHSSEQEHGTLRHTFTAVRKDGAVIELELQCIRAAYLGRPAVLGMIQQKA